MIASALAAGCGRQLNPAFCDDHPDDVDCRNSGMVAIDAPMGECTSSAMCAGNPNGTVCDVPSQTCVQCIVGIDVNSCSGNTPNCGEDHLCHGCVYDANCPASGVCLPAGTCADATAVLYARPGGIGLGTCTQAEPCTFTNALAAVTQTRHIIKLTVDQGITYSEAPITFNAPSIGVQVLGDGAAFEPIANGDALTVSAGNVEILGLSVRNATNDGLACTGGATLALRHTKFTDQTAGFGVSSQGCKVTIERSRFQRNNSGAMSLTAGTLEIRNNIIDHNGNGNLEAGNVQIANSSGRFVFNTVVQNSSKGGGNGRIGGVNCSPASGLAMLISRNIVSDNGNVPFGGNCSVPANSNYTGTVQNARFTNTTEYKLTENSPTTILRDDPEAQTDCQIGTPPKFIDDYEGQIRPAGFCDRGADEYKP